jgi:hypothetical protein
MMYIQQFMERSGISGNEPSNVERVMAEQEEMDLKERQFERQRLESEQRVSIAQSEHERKLQEFDENLAFRQKQEDFDRWRGTEDVKRGLEAQDINRQELEAKKPLYGAQTEETHMRTRLVESQLLGQQGENERNTNEGLATEANLTRSTLISKAATQGYLSPADTDSYENAERILGHNPHMQVDRNPDGTIAHPELLPRAVLNKDGTPTADFAKGLREADRPYNSFSELLADAKNAKAAGASPEMMKHYEDKIWQQTAPMKGQVEGFIMKQMLDEHNIEGAMDYGNAMRRASAPLVKIPDPRERIDYKGTIKMVSRLQKLQDDYWALKKANKIPVGAIKQPFWNFLAYTGKDDPDLQAFRLEAEQFRAKYTLFLSGRATTNEERADIQMQIPGIFSSFQTFEKALPDFMAGLKEDAAIDAGIAKAYGQQIAPNVPVIDPGTVLARDGKLPNVLLEHGAYLSGDAIGSHVKGQQVISRRIAAQGVGGIAGNARNSPEGDRSFYANYGKGNEEGLPQMEGAPEPSSTETPLGVEQSEGGEYSPEQLQQMGADIENQRQEIYKEHPELDPNYQEPAPKRRWGR